MVSTYLTFDLVNRDMQKSLKQVADQTTIANDTKYYQENIGKVTTVDEFLDDYRLYSYAMTAYGLEDMIYAKAFMKQVLESDLSDDNSFANRLTDDRYKDFAAAFNFGVSSTDTATAQSEGQMDELFDTYDQTIAALNDTTEEETRYFNVMLADPGYIDNVDEFLRNDRLRDYMFTSYGYEGTYYNYTAMRGVLTSDPDDPNSYYNTAYGNRLDQYNTAKTEDNELVERQDVMKAIPTLQESISLGQEMKGNLEEQIAAKQEELDNGGDPDVLQPQIDDLQEQLAETEELIQKDQNNLDQKQSRLDELNGKLVPVDQTDARRAELAKTINAIKPDLSFLQMMEKLATDFNFNADGTVPAGGPISQEKLDEVVAGYFDKQKLVTHAEAMFNQDYFEQKVKTATNVSDLTDDPRVLDYIRNAFDLTDAFIVKSTIERILTNDGGIVEEYEETRPQYRELYEAFNFNADGTVEAGKAQTPDQTYTTRNTYMSRWDDAQEEAHDKAIKLYKSDMAAVKTIDDLFDPDAEATLEFALEAVGIDPSEYSSFKLKSVLRSDLSDPNSYIYQLKDERLVTFAKLFNFNKNGDVTTPVMAQSSSTITNIGKDYVLRKTRFLEGDELTTAKKKAEDDVKYYTDAMQRIDSRDEFLADRKLVDIVLTAKGIDPSTVTDDFLKQAFSSDLNDPESFVNKQEDKRFAQIVGSFNFDDQGNLDRSTAGEAQNGGEVTATLNLYLHQQLETQEGDENPGVRLALYFQRMADSITDPYFILGDDALLEFFRVTFQLPEEIGNMEVDQQAKLIEKNLNLEDLADPEKLNKLIERFTMMYDLENNTGTSPALSILYGDDGSAGISADTLWALSQIKAG